VDEHPIPQDQRQDVEGDASAFPNLVTRVFGEENMSDLEARVEALEKKVASLVPKNSGNYPFERDCNRGCGKKVWVQYSRNKQKEYQTNSDNYKDFHNCGDAIPF
tara:strand:+ start:1132 stop:1446 length:315 start_codon:yes stop_codon:yes gene_type:complete